MSAQDRANKTESTSKPSKAAVQRKSNEELPMQVAQRARTNPQTLSPADVVQLQRTIGNQAVQRLIQRCSVCGCGEPLEPHQPEEE